MFDSRVVCTFLCIFCPLGFAFKFDQTHFGVAFTPYVKYSENGTFADLTTYTFQNVKTMLTVISKKFSNVVVHGLFAGVGNYVKNRTYYKDSYASVRSGEAAALINREMGRKALSLSIYLPSQFVGSRKKQNIQLAFESAEKANKIYSGTVTTIFFECVEELPDLQETLDYLRQYNKTASQLNLKLGIGKDCVVFSQPQMVALESIMRKLVGMSSVIIYGDAHNDIVYSPETSFEFVAKNILEFKNFTENINENVELVSWTDWSSSGLRKWENVDNLKMFWKIANDWAVRHNLTIYLQEAFDIPLRQSPPREAHCGWWKLEDNSKINLVNGYIEKVSPWENSNKIGNLSSASSNWIISSIALIVILIIIVFAFVLRFFRTKKSAGLNAKDIKDFIFGNTEESHIEMQNCRSHLENALNGPYDKSLEIEKKNLKIDNSHLLGSGTFGCVFKALVIKDNATEPTEVAVKIANGKCPAAALKGLLSEIKIMSYLGKHSNIVAMVGAYTAELDSGIVYVATELCALGSLESYLRKNHYIGKKEQQSIELDENSSLDKVGKNETEKTTTNIQFQTKIRWCYEIACGMEYLEGKYVVHADLATRNVLLTEQKTAKVSDFGLSRRMYNYTNYVKTHQEPLPWRWMAIESLKRTEFSSKSDVWSYGITLWEIFSNGDVPYQGLSWTPEFSDDLINGLRPRRPNCTSSEMYKLMQKCWSLEPNERPGFSDLPRYFNKLLSGTDGDDKENVEYLSLEECV